MALVETRSATYADLKALPDHMIGQILFGVLHAQPRPTPKHAHAAIELGAEIVDPFRRGRGGPGGWIFLPEPELHLGEHVVVPDIAAWKVERLTPFPETAFITTPPDWVCEVLSPSTVKIDRTDKLAVYAEAGVGYAWYVDPSAHTLEAFKLHDGKWLIAATFAIDAPVTAPPFEAHTFPLSNLWPPGALDADQSGPTTV